jgi:hypothetical protein
MGEGHLGKSRVGSKSILKSLKSTVLISGREAGTEQLVRDALLIESSQCIGRFLQKDSMKGAAYSFL